MHLNSSLLRPYILSMLLLNLHLKYDIYHCSSLLLYFIIRKRTKSEITLKEFSNFNYLIYLIKSRILILNSDSIRRKLKFLLRSVMKSIFEKYF